MAVSIRLRRMGRKKQPHYRVVVAESEYQRDGRFVESLGYYKPLSKPARLVLDLGRVDYWIGQGAQPSDTLRSLISKARAGGDATVALGEPQPANPRPQRTEKPAQRGTQKGGKGAQPSVPQDVAEVTGGSSASDATPAEAMAKSDAAVEDAEGGKARRTKAKTPGADGKEQ
jgi:small subunit ribosomal protein S16